MLTTLPPQTKLVLAALFLLGVARTNCVGQGSVPDLSEASLEQLGSIKVYSASKHMQDAREAPSAVTVVTADDIQQHGYRTLADILESVRGFFTTYDRNYTGLGVSGFARPGDFNTKILLLVDGHRLNDDVYDEAMIGTEFPIDIDLIQRIEIIRGPASSLYGSNAFLAVVNIITKRGENLDGMELSVEAGSFNTYEGRIIYGRKREPLEFLISGTFYGSRGHNRLFYPEFNALESHDGIASHADDDQVASSLATISFHDFRLQGAYGTREKGIPTGAYGTVFNDRGTRTTDSHGYIDLRYEHIFTSDWELLARTFYDRYNYHGTYIYPPDGNTTQTFPNEDFADGKWWGAELQVSKTIFSRHRITAGGEYRDNIRQDQTNYSLNPFTLYLSDRRQSFVAATYVQDEITLAKSLALNLGLRYDHYSHVDSSTDPRTALIYRPWRQTAFKVIYGQSFRVPNVYEMYYSIPPNLPNPDLRPERIRTTEAVWEQGVGSRVWFSASGFRNSIDGLITQEDAGDDLLIFRNLSEVDCTGLELETKVQLARGLEGNASYSFQQTRDSVTNASLSNSPKSLIKFSLTQPLLRKRVFASLDAQYRGRIALPAGGFVSPYSTVSATLFGRRVAKHLDLSASVYNLLDKKYFDPAAGTTLQQSIRQDGRSFRVKMTWHLGER